MNIVEYHSWKPPFNVERSQENFKKMIDEGLMRFPSKGICEVKEFHKGVLIQVVKHDNIPRFYAVKRIGEGNFIECVWPENIDSVVEVNDGDNNH